MTTPEEPPLMQILAGIALMKCYRHPDNWIPGEQTDNPVYQGCMVLLVEEFRLGEGAQKTPEEAQKSITNVKLFLEYLKLTEAHVWFACEPNRDPYLVVPIANRNWDMVLDMLSCL